MGLMDEVAQVLREELNSLSGFATSISLTPPQGSPVALKGFWNDIGLTIDPETGVAVRGRRASVAVPIKDLEAANLPIPENVASNRERPWLVTWTPTTGQAQTMKVVDAIPDKLGIVVLLLESHRSTAWSPA